MGRHVRIQRVTHNVSNGSTALKSFAHGMATLPNEGIPSALTKVSPRRHVLLLPNCPGDRSSSFQPAFPPQQMKAEAGRK